MTNTQTQEKIQQLQQDKRLRIEEIKKVVR